MLSWRLDSSNPAFLTHAISSFPRHVFISSLQIVSYWRTHNFGGTKGVLDFLKNIHRVIKSVTRESPKERAASLDMINFIMHHLKMQHREYQDAQRRMEQEQVRRFLALHSFSPLVACLTLL